MSFGSGPWPEENWPKSTPEAQGVDSASLLNALKVLDLRACDINSMVIIRNGYCIAEYNQEPFTTDTMHSIDSCTGNFTYTLMGIALDEKLVKSRNEKVIEYIPENYNAKMEPDITIDDLLSINSVYENKKIESQLLMDIIHNATDGHSDTYAWKKLLEPLGIKAFAWYRCPEDSLYGAAKLSITTGDLARLGYLYLKNGKWKGNRIVSKQWIKDSENPDTPVLMGGAGMYCFVNKKENLVIAINSNNELIAQRPQISDFVTNDINKTIKSLYSIKDNNRMNKELEDYLKKNAKANPVGPFSDIDALKKKINNKTIRLDKNERGIKTIRIKFDQPNFVIIEQEIKTLGSGIKKYKTVSGLGGKFYKMGIENPALSFYGINDSKVFSRLISARNNFISYENIYNGAINDWFINELEIQGNRVLYRLYTRNHGAREADCLTINGTITD